MSLYAPDGYKYRDPAPHPFQDDTDERVGVILKDTSNRILIVKGPTGKYSFPKGCRHRGETEWEGAMREAWEETGVDLEKEAVDYEEKVKIGHGTYFRFKVPKKEIHIRIEGIQDTDEQIKGVRWMDPNQLRHAQCNHDLKSFVQRVQSKNRAEKDARRAIRRAAWLAAGLGSEGGAAKQTIFIWCPAKKGSTRITKEAAAAAATAE
jgi:8-oxo-dGTP pyrophosphatase MutT (NUDIX family)